MATRRTFKSTLFAVSRRFQKKSGLIARPRHKGSRVRGFGLGVDEPVGHWCGTFLHFLARGNLTKKKPRRISNTSGSYNLSLVRKAIRVYFMFSVKIGRGVLPKGQSAAKTPVIRYHRIINTREPSRAPPVSRRRSVCARRRRRRRRTPPAPADGRVTRGGGGGRRIKEEKARSRRGRKTNTRTAQLPRVFARGRIRGRVPGAGGREGTTRRNGAPW